MKIAVVETTGMVGEIMLKVLAERNFPVTEFSSIRTFCREEIDFKGQNIPLWGCKLLLT
jgi:aspartate-semialdehyde dehydrogenase